MDIMEFLRANYQWFFSGLGCLALGALGKYLFDKKNHVSKSENKNSNLNIGSGNATQIVNQNNYHIANNNIAPQKQNYVINRNDELIFEYIEHALKNLKEALNHLKHFDHEGTNKDYILIQKSLIDNKWSDYIENLSLEVNEVLILKSWFRDVCDIIRYVNSQSFYNQELKNMLSAVLNNQAMLTVREKLINVVKQKRS